MRTPVTLRLDDIRWKMLPCVEDHLRIECAIGTALSLREARLEQRPQRLKQKILRKMPVDPHEKIANIYVDSDWRQQFIQRGERSTCKPLVLKGFAHRPMQCIGAMVMDRLAVNAAFEQCFHQGPAAASAINGV